MAGEREMSTLLRGALVALALGGCAMDGPSLVFGGDDDKQETEQVQQAPAEPAPTATVTSQPLPPPQDVSPQPAGASAPTTAPPPPTRQVAQPRAAASAPTEPKVAAPQTPPATRSLIPPGERSFSVPDIMAPEEPRR